MTEPSSTSIKTIQRRLILILVRAFLVVTVIGMVALIGFTVYEISKNTGRNPFYRDPNATILETYYLGRGSWEGLDSLVDPNRNPESKLFMLDWERAILLDENGTVVMYYGTHMMNMPMGMYPLPTKTEKIPLRVHGDIIGTLIMEKRTVSQPVRLTLRALNPIFIIAALLTLLTVVIGVLLMRRVVNPLSEVIAAAESVAAGKFNTRIKLSASHDDIKALGVHFNHMTETLERNDQERRALLADIAHELRTPLSVMRGRLEGIMDGIYPPNEINIAQALEETYLLERLVEDLRLLTLVETRQLHFELKEINIVELVKKSIDVFEPQATARKIKFEFSTSEPETLAFVDPQRIEQVFGNLISNALKYVPDGGKVQVEVYRQTSHVVINISDTGPGVAVDDLPYIFDRFWRGDKARARSSGGAGLGLAICRQLVEAQGGKISARNREQGGLQVLVELPLK